MFRPLAEARKARRGRERGRGRARRAPLRPAPPHPSPRRRRARSVSSSHVARTELPGQVAAFFFASPRFERGVSGPLLWSPRGSRRQSADRARDPLPAASGPTRRPWARRTSTRPRGRANPPGGDSRTFTSRPSTPRFDASPPETGPRERSASPSRSFAGFFPLAHLGGGLFSPSLQDQPARHPARGPSAPVWRRGLDRAGRTRGGGEGGGRGTTAEGRTRTRGETRVRMPSRARTNAELAVAAASAAAADPPAPPNPKRHGRSDLRPDRGAARCVAAGRSVAARKRPSATSSAGRLSEPPRATLASRPGRQGTA